MDRPDDEFADFLVSTVPSSSARQTKHVMRGLESDDVISSHLVEEFDLEKQEVEVYEYQRRHAFGSVYSADYLLPHDAGAWTETNGAPIPSRDEVCIGSALFALLQRIFLLV